MTVLANDSKNKEQIGAEVLLVAVTSIEIRALFNAFNTSPSDARRYIGDKTYYDFAEVGGVRAVLVRSEMGNEGPAGSGTEICTTDRGTRMSLPFTITLLTCKLLLKG